MKLRHSLYAVIMLLGLSCKSQVNHPNNNTDNIQYSVDSELEDDMACFMNDGVVDTIMIRIWLLHYYTKEKHLSEDQFDDLIDKIVDRILSVNRIIEFKKEHIQI